MTAFEAVLLVFLVFSLVVNIGQGILSYFLYKAGVKKSQENYELMDLIQATNLYFVQNSSFLNGELARNIGNSEAPNFLELKNGLSDMRDKLRLFNSIAEDIKKTSQGG